MDARHSARGPGDMEMRLADWTAPARSKEGSPQAAPTRGLRDQGYRWMEVLLNFSKQTWNSKFLIWNLNLAATVELHWVDQTKQIGGLYSVLGPLTTLNKSHTHLAWSDSPSQIWTLFLIASQNTVRVRILAGWSTFSWSYLLFLKQAFQELIKLATLIYFL